MQFFKRDPGSLKAAKGVSNKTFNPRIKYYDVTYHCIRGGKNFKPRGTGKKEMRLSIYLGRGFYRDRRLYLSQSRWMKLCPRMPQ